MAALLIFLGFGGYLFSTPATALVYDALQYWRLAVAYWPGGEFHFSAFNNILRGYLFPLLLSPLTRLATHEQWLPMNVVRVLGAGTAAALFGVVGPALWQVLAQGPDGRPVPLGRRLVFAGLGFLFWRYYFQYSLTDFPALLALAGCLLLVVRRGTFGGHLLAGALLAAAINFRPVYLASLPLVALLVLWPRQPLGSRAAWAGWGQRLLFGVGLAVVLWPQATINQRHFATASPWVLTSKPGEANLYFFHLQNGLRYQKYETNMGTDYPLPQMFFTDPQGPRLWKMSGLWKLESYDQYWEIICNRPFRVAAVWLRHLFNGLDVQYPTPYIERVYVPTWPLAALNYTVLLAGLWVLGRGLVRRRPGGGGIVKGLAVLALLAPCAGVLPTVMECRFLLPLHLLLYAALAMGAHPVQAWIKSTGRQRALAVSLYGGWLFFCFTASMDAQRELERWPREIFEHQRPVVQPW